MTKLWCRQQKLHHTLIRFYILQKCKNILLASYYVYRSYKCVLHTFFSSYGMLICFQKKNPQNLIFHLIDLETLGLKVKINFPNITYNRMNTYIRKLRVDDLSFNLKISNYLLQIIIRFNVTPNFFEMTNKQKYITIIRLRKKFRKNQKQSGIFLLWQS